jgi:hypothetical protein
MDGRFHSLIEKLDYVCLCGRSFSNNSYVEKRKIYNVDRFLYRSSVGIVPVSHANYKMLIRWRGNRR